MSVPPRFRSVDSGERESRPVLGPTGNKLQRKPSGMKLEKKTIVDSKDEKPKKPNPPASPTTTLKQCSSLCSSIQRRNSASMTASYSSDASSSCESSPLSVTSSSSCKKAVRRSGSVSSSSSSSSATSSAAMRRKQSDEKEEKVPACASNNDCFLDGRKRCAWITPQSDPSYVAFHDEEWGVPVDDDKKLFELLCLSGALSELSWTDILSRRQLLREVFMDFDPVAVSKLNEKKVTTAAISILSEVKLRSIIDNSRHVCKIIDECGSFKKYLWNFVNSKTIQSQFRYQRQVPVKTSKAEFISKDLVRRGFRSVSPTVIYSFMQAVGLTNDHLIGCFRYQDCSVEADKPTTTKAKKKNEKE